MRAVMRRLHFLPRRPVVSLRYELGLEIMLLRRSREREKKEEGGRMGEGEGWRIRKGGKRKKGRGEGWRIRRGGRKEERGERWRIRRGGRKEEREGERGRMDNKERREKIGERHTFERRNRKLKRREDGRLRKTRR